MTRTLRDKTALVVGLGGLGCPAALSLARAGVGRLILVDEDDVAIENLHRQILYREEDVGRAKVDSAKAALLAEGAGEVEAKRVRFLPENAEQLALSADVIVEGADNFATKFLACDAAHLARRPVVHGAAIRWHGTALLAAPLGRPCYRCLFEDLLPDHLAPQCSTAGVIGPVVGIVGALMADLALDALASDYERAGQVLNVDAKRNTFRKAPMFRRHNCSTCRDVEPLFGPLTRERYTSPLNL
jgi:molybdopterin/thiamine biosynthesis adenylyltransferase